MADRVIYRLWAPPSAFLDHALLPDPSPATVAAIGAPSPSPSSRRAGGLPPSSLPDEGDDAAVSLLGTPVRELEMRVVAGESPRLAPGLKLALHVSLSLLLNLCFCLGLGPRGVAVLPVWACERVVCDGTPAPEGEPVCARSAAGVTLYLLCGLYLLLSALQLKHGLPLIPTEHPLTGAPDLYRYYVHVVGMSFPFLWEMRTSLDWTVSPTSLSLFEWLKLEDIYVGLVSVRAAMAFKRMYPLGAKRGLGSKLGTGALFVALVLLLILGPMFVFSSANPISEPNLVKSASLRLTLRTPTGLFPLGTISRFNNDLDRPLSASSPVLAADCTAKQLQAKENDDCGYAYLLPLEANVDYQQLVFAEASDLLWAITPQALHELSDTLARPELEVHLEATVEWTRELGVGGTNLARLANTVKLTPLQREQVYIYR